MKTLRTPDERFENMPGYPYAPNYIEVPDGEDGILRIHHVDEGPRDAAPANRKAWEVFSAFEKPFLTAFSDHDPVTAGGDKVLQKLIPGAADQAHTTIQGGGHFLQEDCGEEFAHVVVDFMTRTSS